jgi:CAAX protease family protein
MNAQTVFFNERKRLRSGWRLLIFLLAFFFLAGLLQLILTTFFSALKLDNHSGRFVSLFSAVFLGWLCGKYLEDLPFRALGAWFTKNWLRDLFAGIILGALALALAVLIGMIFGGLSFRFNAEAGTNQILQALAFSLFVFIIAGAAEEALFRGYILQTFARARLAWLAVFLTSVFFALVHLDNPSANYISTLNTILAGIWFSVAYLKTRTLWLPFGLHVLWNWTQGSVFGIEVSGYKLFADGALLREIEQSPAWLTGGDYGIEAGFAATIAIIFSIVLIYFLPFLNPTEEMLALTSEEKPKTVDS